MNEDDFKILKKEFPDKWQYLNKKLAYPYEYCKSVDDCKKPVNILNKEDFSSKLKKCPDDEEVQRAKEVIKMFEIKTGEKLTKLYLKSDVIF